MELLVKGTVYQDVSGDFSDKTHLSECSDSYSKAISNFIRNDFRVSTGDWRICFKEKTTGKNLMTLSLSNRNTNMNMNMAMDMDGLGHGHGHKHWHWLWHWYWHWYWCLQTDTDTVTDRDTRDTDTVGILGSKKSRKSKIAMKKKRQQGVKIPLCF